MPRQPSCHGSPTCWTADGWPTGWSCSSRPGGTRWPRREEAGVTARLAAGGAELLVDTCSYISPILRDPRGPVMTDSGKWAYYAPGNIGAQVVLGSLAECVASAVAGHVVRDEAWGSP